MSSQVLLLTVLSGLLLAQPTRVGNLRLENIPEIPDQVVERTRAYQNVRSASFRSWDPTGEGMLIVTRFGQTTQLHYVTQPLGTRRQVTFFEEPVGGGLLCPDPQQGGFLYTKDVGGNEYYQIFYFDPETDRARLLSDGKSRHGLGPWSHDGQYFLFNRADGVDTHVYRSSLDGSPPLPLVKEPGTWFPLDWSDDDSRVLVEKYISINESTIHLVDIASGEMTPINPSDQAIAYGTARFSGNGAGIYYTSDEESEFRQLRYYDLNSGQQRIISGHIPWNVTGINLSEDGRYLAYVTNEDGISRIHVIKTRSERELRLPELPLGRIGGLVFHPDNRHLALTVNTPRTPGDVFVLDLLRGALIRWTQSEVGGLNTEAFVVPELVHLKSFDGLEVSGFLFKPRGTGPFPVVIYIHGGPESQYTPGFSSTFQYWINELGLAVLATNVRGSNGYGKSFLLLDNGFKREDSVRDIGAFIDWIGTQPELDAGRVAVYGGSYGGYMVLATMTHFSDRLRAGAERVGISNFVTFLENTKDYRRDLRRAEYGDERDPAMRAHLEAISPTNNVHKITKPLLIAQGQNDPRVPASESEQMRDVIRAGGQDVWYMLALDEGHGFRKKFNRDYYSNAVSLFWETHLLK